MLNRFEVRNIPLYNYWSGEYLCHWAQLCIDGTPLGDIVNLFWDKIERKTGDGYDGKLLAFTFSPGLEWEYCDRFMTWILEKRTETVIPILLCDGDTDFECLTVAVRMRFDENYAYMDEMGVVCNEKKKDDSAYGILYTDSYTDEDWERYGCNIALEKVFSPEWEKWVFENYQEEMFRRLKNYYYPFLLDRDNLEVFYEPHYKFRLSEWERVIRFYASHDPKDMNENDIPAELRGSE